MGTLRGGPPLCSGLPQAENPGGWTLEKLTNGVDACHRGSAKSQSLLVHAARYMHHQPVDEND